jgi:hypothetical protein
MADRLSREEQNAKLMRSIEIAKRAQEEDEIPQWRRPTTTASSD